MNAPASARVVTLTMNPAIDRTVTVANFRAGEVNRVSEVREQAGGKGVNVAAMLADYDVRVTATGLLGSENTAPFEARLAHPLIDERFVRTAGATRISIKIVDPVLAQTTDLNFPGPRPLPGEVERVLLLLERSDADWFVLAGSLPEGVSPTFYRDLTVMLKRRGKRVILDTSGEPLRHALEAAPHLIKPNRAELEALLGESLTSELAVVAAARKLLEHGIEQVVVSLGKAGACFVTRAGALVARPPDVQVESTVGAGDAMVAGLVAAELEGLSPEDCARLSTAFSVHALTRHSAASPSRAAIAQLRTLVHVE